MTLAAATAFVFGCTLLTALPVEPNATLFENDQVKVLRALEKPHVKGKFHEHKLDRVMIYLQPGRQRFEYQDGRKPEEFTWTAGQVKWSPPDGMHSPEVTTGEPFNIVEVELKTTGKGHAILNALDPVKVDPRHYTVEFENERVRVLRVKIGPGEAAPMHEHSLNRVTVYLSSQDFQATTSGGKVESVHHNAGDTAWGTPITHKEQNTAPTAFEAIVVEIKAVGN